MLFPLSEGNALSDREGAVNPKDPPFGARMTAFGAIAQLGERLDRTQEVGGSSPPSSISVSAYLHHCPGG